MHFCNNPTTCTCNNLECVESIKYLGIINFLRWDGHIDSTSTKARKFIHLFIFISNISCVKDMKLIYYVISNSLLEYASLGWDACAKTILDPSAKAQKSLLRVKLKNLLGTPVAHYLNRWVSENVRQLYIRKNILYTHIQRPMDHYHNTKHSRSNPIVPLTTL